MKYKIFTGIIGSIILGILFSMSGAFCGAIVGGAGQLCGVWSFLPVFFIILCIFLIIGVVGGFLMGLGWPGDSSGPYDEDIMFRELFVNDVTKN